MTHSNTQTVSDFVAAINSHNLETIGTLMTDDHTFIDSHGNQVVGKGKMQAGWKGYFAWFPDYKIEIETMMENACPLAESSRRPKRSSRRRGDTVAAFGFASGTFNGVPTSDKKNHWRLPASWKAIVVNGKIKLWQVFADTKIPFDIIDTYSMKPADTLNWVTGIGGVFFKSKDPKMLTKWYDEHLGTKFGEQQSYGFKWRERNNPDSIGRTELGIFGEKTKYFLPSEKPFMLNFRVKNLDELLKKLKQEGVHIEEKVESYDYGKFGWILDPEGNKIELWEAVDKVLEK